ncbi:MAG: Enhancer of polycomb-like protein 1 [Chrysothrix sp. TS-e1954]|nr:MAG: Enhancer of polycomb-like protein 1 [Chrysothrix sp. TS-e1954]
MRGQQSSTRFRQRKLNTKSNLRILREDDLDPGHVDLGASVNGSVYGDGEGAGAATSLPKVESGVESKEEKEHHLQAAINAAQAASIGGKVAAISIPTPDTIASSIKYDALHPTVFAQPATYIRFSSTVEDCTGTPYCMNVEDEVALKSINAKASDGQQCSEDQFEQVLSAFEEISAVRQPFAAVDANTPVLALEELEAEFDMENVDDGARSFAPEVYEYWKSRRIARGNKTLIPKLKTLKMDSGQDADDADPYVCFRRREVRQARKTRGRDTQVVEKLKKLRRELEEARELLSLVKQRETGKREHLAVAKQVYEQRAEVREKKRALGIQDETDDLLIDQREPKRPKPEINLRPTNGLGPRKVLPQDMPPSLENDLVDFKAKLASRDRSISARIEDLVKQHDERSKDFIDDTNDVLQGRFRPDQAFLASKERKQDDGFVGIRLVAQQQQPTPPPSAPPSVGSPSEDEIQSPKKSQDPIQVRWADYSQQELFRDQPRFRRRQGRGGRFMVDRHNIKAVRSNAKVDEIVQDRCKYDDEDGDETDESGVPFDESDVINTRALWMVKDLHASQMHRRASSRDAATTATVSGASTVGPPAR